MRNVLRVEPGFGFRFFIVFHSIQSELPYRKVVSFAFIVYSLGLDQHDRQSHRTSSRRAVRDRFHLCNSGELEVCGLGDVFLGFGLA